RELALWGARSLGPPTDADELFEGWLANAVDTMLGPFAPEGTFEFRVGDEVATLTGGVAHEGAAEDPDVVVTAAREGMDFPLIQHRVDGGPDEGNYKLLEQVLAAAAPSEPVAV